MTKREGVLGLAEIRRNRGISLEQIADSTKLGVRTLEAIERGEFRKLPGGIYNTNYIRQYARAIDYDESALLEFYHRETDVVPEVAAAPQPPAGGFRPLHSIFNW
jgi:cytoskeletal protein RodZ